MDQRETFQNKFIVICLDDGFTYHSFKSLGLNQGKHFLYSVSMKQHHHFCGNFYTWFVKGFFNIFL